MRDRSDKLSRSYISLLQEDRSKSAKTMVYNLEDKYIVPERTIPELVTALLSLFDAYVVFAKVIGLSGHITTFKIC